MFDVTNQYQLSLIINGQPLTEYWHQGLAFVEGRTNSDYELRIKNNSAERIMAIPSVDGLNVIDGKPAGSESSGYVLEPFQGMSIPGWKVDSSTAAKFRFGSTSDSYSKRSGKGKKNVGVVGLMVFKERPPTLRPFDNCYSYYDSSPIPPCIPTFRASSSIGTMPMQNLGTGYGDAEYFKTSATTFEKRDPNYPDSIMCIYYDDARGLEARGIILPYRNTSPQAFPKYAKPPPGWTR